MPFTLPIKVNKMNFFICVPGHYEPGMKEVEAAVGKSVDQAWYHYQKVFDPDARFQDMIFYECKEVENAKV